MTPDIQGRDISRSPIFAYNRLLRLLSELTPVVDEFMLEAPEMRPEAMSAVHKLSERALESIVKLEETSNGRD